MDEQVRTYPTSVESIMESSAFALGVRDVRNGTPPRVFPGWDIDWQWNYERGRAWATVAPRTMPVRIRGKLNRAALAIGSQDGVIL